MNEKRLIRVYTIQVIIYEFQITDKNKEIDKNNRIEKQFLLAR